MAGLTWAGVDFPRRVLTIFMPKVSRTKTLRMSPEMERVLSGLTRESASPVFTDAKGRAWRTGGLDQAFHRILRAARLDKGGVHGGLTTHSIRHTAATWARKAEVPLDRISGILGRRTRGQFSATPTSSQRISAALLRPSKGPQTASVNDP